MWSKHLWSHIQKFKDATIDEFFVIPKVGQSALYFKINEDIFKIICVQKLNWDFVKAVVKIAKIPQIYNM